MGACQRTLYPRGAGQAYVPRVDAEEHENALHTKTGLWQEALGVPKGKEWTDEKTQYLQVDCHSHDYLPAGGAGRARGQGVDPEERGREGGAAGGHHAQHAQMGARLHPDSYTLAPNVSTSRRRWACPWARSGSGRARA